MTTTALHTTIRDTLTAAGIHAVIGPAPTLPDTTGGQAAILWPHPPLGQYGRLSGGRSGRTHTLTVICVGHTTLDALAAADNVDNALAGLHVGGGILTQTLAVPPTPEPGAAPARVQVVVEYTVITKGT